MLYWMMEKTNQPLTMEQLEHAVRRNFGGLDDVDAVGIFKKNVHIAAISLDVQNHNVSFRGTARCFVECYIGC